MRGGRGIPFDGKKVCVRHYERFNDWAWNRWQKARRPGKFEEYVKALPLDDYLEESGLQAARLSKIWKSVSVLIGAALLISFVFVGGEEIKTAEGLFRSFGRFLAIGRGLMVGVLIALTVILAGWFLWQQWAREVKTSG